MSELINTRDNRATIRWKLLTSASALALTAYVSSVNVAKAEDADRPLIWIELGGQMESVQGQGAAFAPPFLAANPDSPVFQKVTPLQAQQPPKFDFSEQGQISFQPEGSDWVFSAAIRYGRSGNNRHVDHQTRGTYHVGYQSGVPTSGIRTNEDYADTHAAHSEQHTILDFSVGKDVGLGLFGKDASSTLGVGVRFAQFGSNAAFNIRARPDLHFKYFPSAAAPGKLKLPYFHAYYATGHASRNFRGVGPSLSWNGSAPFVGNQQDGELTFDWGLNAALLFGRQKARVQHQTSGHYETGLYKYNRQTYPAVPHGHPNDRSVTVPNVGGSVGLSWRLQDFKVSMGYRADIFFGAMDTGIDTVKKSNMTFNGPYASISVGLGD